MAQSQVPSTNKSKRNEANVSGKSEGRSAPQANMPNTKKDAKPSKSAKTSKA